MLEHSVFVGVISMLLFEAAVARRTVKRQDIPVLRRTLDRVWTQHRVGI